jgi:hypothetical protein
MTRAIDRLLVCVYALAIALPAIAMITGAPDMPLSGVVAEVERPPLRWASFRKEEYQHELTRWFERHIGLRGVSVRTDNSWLLHGLDETKRDVGVMIGDDGVLFEKDDIAFYSRLADETIAPGLAEPFAQKLAALQRRLAAEGRALVPVIIPSKTSLYGAEVPAIWARDLGDPRPSDLEYLAYRRAFEAHGVRYVDGRALLTAPTERRDQVWGVGARHWTTYGACLAMRGVMEQYAALTSRQPVDYPCLTVWQPVQKRDPDFDLLNLLNAWGVRQPQRVAPIVVGLAPAAASPMTRPKTLIVGSSFAWGLVKDARRAGLTDELHVYYYNRSLVIWPENRVIPLDVATPAWTEFVADRDLIVLDLFEPYNHPQGYSQQFVDQLAAALAATPATAP